MANIRDQLVGAVGKHMSSEKEKKELAKLKSEFEINNAEIDRLLSIFVDIKKIIREDEYDNDIEKLLDKYIDNIRVKFDNVLEIEFVDDIVEAGSIIGKQKKLINEINNLVNEMADVADVEIIRQENSETINSNKQNEDIQDIGDVDESNGKYITWHIAKEEANKYAKENAQIGDMLRSIKNEISLRSKKIDKLKGKEKTNAIEQLKAFKEKSAHELYNIVQERKEYIKKQEKKKQESKTVTDKDEINTFFDEIIFEAQKNHAQDSAQIRDMLDSIRKTVKQKKKEIGNASTKIQRQTKITELINLKSELAQKLQNIIKEKIEFDIQNKSEKVKEKKLVKSDKIKQFEVNRQQIVDDVDTLFESEEIENYIGVGKSKKVIENKNRIKLYKKEIIESIAEIEKVARRKINRSQFALDYVQSKSASKVAHILEDKIKKINRQKQIKDVEKIRMSADITFAQMNKYDIPYDKLNGNTVDEGDNNFGDISREAWKEFAVRGFLERSRETGKVEVRGMTNTDGRVAMMLFKNAGMDISDLIYVAPGDYIKNKINIDTGNRDGLVILSDGTVIIDHHGQDSSLDTSAAQEVYKVLTDLRLLEKTQELDKLISFVNDVDNFDYPDADEFFKNYFKNAGKTMLSVYKMLPPHKLLAFFQYKNQKTGGGLSPAQPLSLGLLRKFGIENNEGDKKKSRGQKARERAKEEYKILQDLEREGLILQSKRYGKICISVNGNVSNESVRAFGCDTVILWNKSGNGFFISSLVGKPIKDKFGQGKNIRKTMWIKPNSQDDKLTIQLKDVLEKMTDGKLETSDKLAYILNNNGERTNRIELSSIDEKKLEFYIDYVREMIDYINNTNYDEFGLKTEKAVQKEKKKLIKEFWQQFEKDLKEDKQFGSVKNERDVLTLIRDKI